MGIKNLNNLIEEFTNFDPNNKKDLQDFSGKTFAIDANLFIYKFLYANGNHINGLFFMINKLSKFNIKPIFVFDGCAPEEKKNTINNRKKVKKKIITQVINLKINLNIETNPQKKNVLQKKILNLEKRLVYVDKNVLLSSKKLLDLMNIVHLQAETEAEHLCSNLSRIGKVDGVISDDTDSIACGSKIVLRNFTNKYDFISYYNLDEILYDLDLKYDEFLDLCILLGTDYNKKIRNISFKRAYELIREYRSLNNIQKNTNYNIVYNYEKIRQLFKSSALPPDILTKLQSHKLSYTTNNMDHLIKFLENNSTIKKKTFLYRLKKIYKVDNDREMLRMGDIKSQFNMFDSEYKISSSNIQKCGSRI